MKIEMKKFPKIGQLKDVIHEVKRTGQAPKLDFVGTVKLHGTNAAIRYDRDQSGELQVSFQSRNRLISLGDDNQGFCHWCHEVLNLDTFRTIMNPTLEEKVIYGEFCGGNIQSGVGISQLDRMFVTFPTLQYPGQMLAFQGDQGQALQRAYEKTLDFANLGSAPDELQEITLAVEAECPVAKQLGVDNGVGEGVVWRCVTPGWEHLMFKVKGEKHSKSKVKTLDPETVAKQTKAEELAHRLLTGERLHQGLEYLGEMGMEPITKNTGHYLSYVVKDCVAEETLAIAESGVDEKLLRKALGGVARHWYAQQS